MSRPVPSVLAVATLASLFGVLVNAHEPGTTARPIHFVAELAGELNERNARLMLDVTFHGKRPGLEQLEDALRNLLKAAVAIHPGRDIFANAWHRESSSSAKREKLKLKDGADGLVYVAKDRTTRPMIGGAISASAGEPEQDNMSSILGESGVAKACSSVASERLSSLIVAASEEPGRERKHILKAMRTWCKDNNVAVDRSLRSCLSAISKAVVASAESNPIAPVDLAASIARGATGYANRGCTKCHLASGGGGVRGPSLIDDQWEHCDGSLEGIRKVLVSGVPRNKLKDASRPFAMNPVGGPGTSGQDLADIAAFVQSLSQK